MTIEEKMEHFKNVSLENASNKSNDILTAYKKSLDEQFEKHKEDVLIESKSLEESKLQAAKTESRRQLSKAQSEVKRAITLHQNKLTADVFSSVNERLNKFKQTEDYKILLTTQIRSVLSDFNDATVVFYIDATDKSLLDDLIKETGADIKISQVSFIGGTKAIIDSRNMLVDNSFKTKLSEEQEKFSISF